MLPLRDNKSSTAAGVTVELRRKTLALRHRFVLLVVIASGCILFGLWMLGQSQPREFWIQHHQLGYTYPRVERALRNVADTVKSWGIAVYLDQIGTMSGKDFSSRACQDHAAGIVIQYRDGMWEQDSTFAIETGTGCISCDPERQIPFYRIAGIYGNPQDSVIEASALCLERRLIEIMRGLLF